MKQEFIPMIIYVNWLKAVTGVTALLLLTGPLRAESKSQSAIMAFNKGAKALNAENCSEAISFFDQAIEKDDQFAEAYFARAMCKRDKENLQGAISDLNSAIRYKNEYTQAYGLRGSILYEQERWEEAFQDFNYVIEREPQNAPALLGRGLTSLRLDHPTRARKDLAKFVRLVPNDPMATKIKRFLGSFEAEEPPATRAAHSEESSEPSERPMSARSEQLAKELFFKSRQMADNYGNKVLRAERAEAEGDIYSHTQTERPR